MKPIERFEFEHKPVEAGDARSNYRQAMIRTQMNRSDWLTLGLLALIWGGAFFFIGVAVRHVQPLTYVWLRLTIASAGLWAYVHFKRERLAIPRHAWGSILLLAVLNNALPFALFGWSQTHIASGLASILNATTPIWGVIVAHLFTRDERMSAGKITGLLLGVTGVGTMIGPSLASNLGSSTLAELACLAASLSYALAAVWARRFRSQGISPLSVTTGQLTAGALVMLPLSMIIEHPWAGSMPPLNAWCAIIALALLCTALGYVLYFRLIATAGATNALLVTLLVPPVAILLGAMFLGETLALTDFEGLALIALGLAAIDGRLISFFLQGRLPTAV